MGDPCSIKWEDGCYGVDPPEGFSAQSNVQDKKKTARMRLKRKDVKRKKLMENVVKNISRKIVKRHVDTARIRTTKPTTKSNSIQSTRPWLTNLTCVDLNSNHVGHY